MNLADHLRLRTPMVWVTTTEPARLIDAVTALVTDRPVYRIDALDGLVVWTPDGWRKQLITVEGQTTAGTLPFMLQLEWVLDHGGTLVLDTAHTVAELLANHAAALSYRFRQTYLADNLDLLPAQVVLASHKEVPEDLAALVASVGDAPVGREELAQVAAHLAAAAEWDIVADAFADAAVGLSEATFVTTLLGAALHDRLTPEAVHASKVAAVRAGGLLEIRSAEATLDAIGGLDLAKDLLRRIAWLRAHPDVARELDITPLRRMLLIGVPGSGKSLVCEVAARLLGLDLAKGGVAQSMNKYVGESERGMREVFRLLRVLAPIVFWIDEFGRDVAGGQSSAEVDAGTTARVHGEFLTGLQELPPDVFLLAAANSLASLPPEMTRKDRFDKVLFVGLPTHSERNEIFGIHLGARADEHDLDILAEASEHFTGAEIKSVIADVRFTIGTDAQRPPSTEDYLSALGQVRSRAWTTHRHDITRLYATAMGAWDWASSAQQAEAEKVLSAATSRNGQEARRVTPVRAHRGEW